MARSTLEVPVILREIDRGIRTYLSRKTPVTLYEPPRYLFAGGGKRLRAVIVLLSCAVVGADYRKAMDVAVAVEILHNFSLIHDDIMDHDDLRRGRPTIHKKWDQNVAILSGDLLAAVAFKALSSGPAAALPKMATEFSNGFIRLCEGQALDKEYENRAAVSEREYLKMIGLKTASLFSLAARLGAIAGGATTHQEVALAAFGKHLGLAFQIQDDWLDVSAKEDVLGKSIGSDLIEHKKTYLSILAAREPDGARWLQRFSAGLDADTHRRLLREFADYLESSGIRQKTERLIDRYVRAALAQLRKFPDRPARRLLIDMTERMWKRQN